MPNLYFRGVIELISSGSFVNRESGATVLWYKNYVQVQGQNGMQVIELNSSKDFTSYKGKECDFTVALYAEGKGYKLSLKACEVVE